MFMTWLWPFYCKLSWSSKPLSLVIAGYTCLMSKNGNPSDSIKGISSPKISISFAGGQLKYVCGIISMFVFRCHELGGGVAFHLILLDVPWCSMIFRWINRASPILGAVKMGENRERSWARLSKAATAAAPNAIRWGIIGAEAGWREMGSHRMMSGGFLLGLS